MSRPSTVAPVSYKVLKQLIDFCKKNSCGVIIRVKGVEHAYDLVNLESYRDFWRLVTDAGFSAMVRKGWDSPTNL